MSKVCHNIPSDVVRRRGIFRDILDFNHFKFCMNEEFHTPCVESFDSKCLCRYCGEHLEHFHARFDCNPFKTYPKYEVTEHKEFKGQDLSDKTNSKENQTVHIKCGWCKYSSVITGKVEMHIKVVHLKIKDFECIKCDYKTSQKGRLNTLIKSVHPEI